MRTELDGQTLEDSFCSIMCLQHCFVSSCISISHQINLLKNKFYSFDLFNMYQILQIEIKTPVSTPKKLVVIERHALCTLKIVSKSISHLPPCCPSDPGIFLSFDSNKTKKLYLGLTMFTLAHMFPTNKGYCVGSLLYHISTILYILFLNILSYFSPVFRIIMP